ncbi:MAG: type II toxin-antitoxin system RatA family toxin [Rickettsiales bacterium]|nr:type II toxin-antitoxin system RatA family toxin [Rickettsiales bacterium]
MHTFKEVKNVESDPAFICDIVMDIEKYPEFLPWCSQATILNADSDKVIAELSVSFNGISESYISEVQIYKEEQEITIISKAISGPFKYLESKWVIKQLDKVSQVQFSIDFEFKSRILDMVIGLFFSLAIQKMIDAFEQRLVNLKNQLV